MATKIILIPFLILALYSAAQEEENEDTTRINTGNYEVLIINKNKQQDAVNSSDTDSTDLSNENIDEDEENDDGYEAHWAGVDLGFNQLLNSNFSASFPASPYWNNDAAKSLQWNFNIVDHKLPIYREYIGITTGLGISLSQYAFTNGYLLNYTSDSLQVSIDSISTYSKNKLKATYLTVPLLLEICSSESNSNQFYVAAGVVGGVKLGSRIRREGEVEGKHFDERLKGSYGLNSFKLDATARIGYGDWGLYAAYSLTSLFNKGVTTELHPLNFGLSLNF